MSSNRRLFKLVTVLAFTLLMGASRVSGQNVLAFTPNGLSGWPDTTYATDSTYVGAFLKNYSPDSMFTDSFRVDGYVDTGSFVFFSIPFYNLYGNFYLQPLDSSFLILPFVFNTGSQGGFFHVGNNVVVVWPVSVGPGSFQTGDSVTVNVFLIDTLSSLGPEYPGANIRIYPIPSNGPLYISSYHPQYRITEVTIRDAAGREVYHGGADSGPIDTSQWAPGLYTVEALLNNGSKGYYKIIR